MTHIGCEHPSFDWASQEHRPSASRRKMVMIGMAGALLAATGAAAAALPAAPAKDGTVEDWPTLLAEFHRLQRAYDCAADAADQAAARARAAYPAPDVRIPEIVGVFHGTQMIWKWVQRPARRKVSTPDPLSTAIGIDHHMDRIMATARTRAWPEGKLEPFLAEGERLRRDTKDRIWSQKAQCREVDRRHGLPDLDHRSHQAGMAVDALADRILATPVDGLAAVAATLAIWLAIADPQDLADREGPLAVLIDQIEHQTGLAITGKASLQTGSESP